MPSDAAPLPRRAPAFAAFALPATLSLLALLALPTARAQTSTCELPASGMVRIPRPGPSNLVVCASNFVSGFDTEKTGKHCVYVCDGLVTGAVKQERPHPASEGTDFVDAEGLWVVPGFVDLVSSAGIPFFANEESSEVTPALAALDFVDPADPRFRQALEAGVTSVALSPGGRAVIGGLTVLIKTDDRALAQRVVSPAANLSATLGYEPMIGNRSSRQEPPSSYYYRRPGNRMGLAAELERSFFAAREGRIEDPYAAAVLAAAMEGRLKVAFRARKDQDIRTALRLASDFGLSPIIFDGTESWRLAGVLAERGVPVVLGPLYQQPRRGFEVWEGDDPRSAVAALLDEAGVTVAFGSGADEPQGSLREWAMLSVRHGMDRHRALLALNARPAEILGLEARIGRISWGNDADMVILDGHPLEPTSRVLMTIVNGRVAHAHEDAPKLTAVGHPSASLIGTGDPR